MQVVPKFTIHKNQNEDEGVFEWGQSRNSLFEAYNNAANHYFMAEIEETQKNLEILSMRIRISSMPLTCWAPLNKSWAIPRKPKNIGKKHTMLEANLYLNHLMGKYGGASP